MSFRKSAVPGLDQAFQKQVGICFRGIRVQMRRMQRMRAEEPVHKIELREDGAKIQSVLAVPITISTADNL